MTDSHSFDDPSGSLEHLSNSSASLQVPSVLPINTMKTLRGLQSSPDTQQMSRAQLYALPSLGTTPGRQVSNSDFQFLKSVLELRPVVRLERADRIVGNWPGVEFYRAYIRVVSVFREICQAIVTSPFFDAFITLVIVVNTVTTALVDGNQPSSWSLLADDICLYVYSAEAGIKVQLSR